MSGYSSAVAKDSDIAAIYPQYGMLLGSVVVEDLLSGAYAELYPLVRDQCRKAGHDPVQIADASVLARAEAYMALALLWQMNAVPDREGSADSATKQAAYNRKLAGDAVNACIWEYNSSVSLPVPTNIQQPGIGCYFTRS